MAAKVSIIIPVFNCRSFVHSCVETILSQSMQELEVVLVDDHSEDGSIEAFRSELEGYSGPVEFVFSSTPQNSGPGAARNIGLEKASGEYVAFLDSDDSIDSSFCAELYSSAAGRDMACCDLSIERNGSSVVKRNPDVGEPFCRKRYLRRFVSYFTTYIYRRDFLLRYGIKFPGTRSAEDSCFLTCCLLLTDGLGQVHKALYSYQMRESSVSLKRDASRSRNRLASWREVRKFSVRNGIYFKNLLTIEFLIFKKGLLLALKDIIC